MGLLRPSPEPALEQPVAWARTVVGLAAVGYSLVATLDIVTGGTSLENEIEQAVVAVIACGAFLLSGRRPRLAAALVLVAAWVQLVLALLISSEPVPALIVFPVLVLGAGLLVGWRAATWLGALSCLAIPAGYLVGKLRLTGSATLGGHELTWLLVAAFCTVGAAFLVRTTLKSYGRLLGELLEAKVLLTALVDSTTDLIWSVDAEEFRLLTFNRALRDYFRRGQELEIRGGMTPAEVLPTAELAERFRGFYRRALREGPYTLEYQTSSGGLVLGLHFNLLEREGRVFGISVFGQDLTEQRRAEVEHRAAEEKYRQIVENAPMGIYRRHIDGEYLYVNRGTIEQFECTSEAEFRSRYGRISDRWARPARHEAFKALLLAERQVLGYEVEVRLVGGKTKWFSLYAFLDDTDQVVSGFSVDVTASKAADAERRTLQAQLRALASRLQRSREEENTRIARNLHDELGQMLTGLKMDLLWIEGRFEAMPPGPETNALLERAVAAADLSDQAVTRVQQIATDLRPATLDRLGLGAALQEEARRFQTRTGVRCEASVPETLPTHASDAATVLFRITQEALTNVARHAHASSVGLRLDAPDGHLELRIEDDGVGIDPGEAARPHSLGLLGMMERASLQGGDVTFVRRLPRGTVVVARVPLVDPGDATEAHP